MRPPAGVTPKGYELYRRVGTDEYSVRVPVTKPDSLLPLETKNTVRSLHRRVPIGRFGSFTEAAIYADTEAWR